MLGSQMWRVLFLGTCLLCAALLPRTVVGASLPLPITVNYYTSSDTLYDDNTASQSFYSANALCMANGMNLFSAESTTRQQRMWTLAQNKFGNGATYASYTLISAMKTAQNSLCIYTNLAAMGRPQQPSPYYCMFTIQWGLFSEYTVASTYGYQPGVPIYTCVYSLFTGGTKCGQNSVYTDAVPWDTTVANPNGQNFTLLYTGTARDDPKFANVAATAPTDYYIPLNRFVTSCEAQMNLANPAQSFTPTQPAFVKGYKDLTWVQQHWWVLFLIIAIVILIVLFAILIYCCLTSVPPKEGPPIAPMVLRERNGQAYVNASDDEDATPKSRALNLGDLHQSNGTNDGHNQQQQLRGQQQQHPDMMMMPMPVVDPEDLIQATPSIYSQDDVMQTAEGDSLASDDEDSNTSDEGERR